MKNAEKEKRNFTCVPNVKYSNRDKFTYGSVLQINGMDYFVPISSKINKNQEYNLNIVTDDKKDRIKGSLRFPYMIPVPHQMLRKLVIDEEKDNNRKTRISKELKFCRKNKDKIEKYAKKTYLAVTNSNNENLKNNSCDFKLLEQVYIKYCIENNIQISSQAKASLKTQNIENNNDDFVIKIVNEEQVSLLSENKIQFQIAKKDGKTAIKFSISQKDEIEKLLNNPSAQITKK